MVIFYAPSYAILLFWVLLLWLSWEVGTVPVVKEREMEIGYPTDVKHVAHIGWDGPSGTGPSWVRSWLPLYLSIYVSTKKIQFFNFFLSFSAFFCHYYYRKQYIKWPFKSFCSINQYLIAMLNCFIFIIIIFKICTYHSFWLIC